MISHSNSLPVPHLQPLDNKRHIEYDEANQSKNCVNKYEKCPGSVWDVELSGRDLIENCPWNSHSQFQENVFILNVSLDILSAVLKLEQNNN